MNGIQTQKVAQEWLAYDRSEKARLDRVIDASLRAQSDAKFGHVSGCSLLKCDPKCQRDNKPN